MGRHGVTSAMALLLTINVLASAALKQASSANGPEEDSLLPSIVRGRSILATNLRCTDFHVARFPGYPDQTSCLMHCVDVGKAICPAYSFDESAGTCLMKIPCDQKAPEPLSFPSLDEMFEAFPDVILQASSPANEEPAKPSINCCDNLPFLNADSSDVCALPAPGCVESSSFLEASDICAKLGARMCTLNEVENGEASGGGCDTDGSLIWTATECTSAGQLGHWHVSAEDAEAKNCVPDSTAKAGVHCCAEACERNPGDLLFRFRQSASSRCCKDLPFINSDMNHVCAGSSWPGHNCAGDADFFQARNTCLRAGARLCSIEELENMEAKGSGCGSDNQTTWTASPCSAGSESGHWAGRGDNGSQKTCLADRERKGAVRCCADVCPSKAASRKCCEELAFVNSDGNDVCAGSSWPEQNCQSDASYLQARNTCLRAGARLCSIEELENMEAKGSGCGSDNQTTWTASPCSAGSESGHWAGRGDNGSQKTCLADRERKGAVRCCADVCRAGSASPTPADSQPKAPQAGAPPSSGFSFPPWPSKSQPATSNDSQQPAAKDTGTGWGSVDTYDAKCAAGGSGSFYWCNADCSANCAAVGMNGLLVPRDLQDELQYCSSRNAKAGYGVEECCCGKLFSADEIRRVTVPCHGALDDWGSCDTWCRLHSMELGVGSGADCSPGKSWCFPFGLMVPNGHESCLAMECSNQKCCCNGVV